VLRNEIALDWDDVRWLVVRTLGIVGLSTEPLPPQGSYNAGQKLFGLVVSGEKARQLARRAEREAAPATSASAAPDAPGSKDTPPPAARTV